MATAVSPLGNVQWIYAGSYTEEINREIKWHSAWASHYFKQGGVGDILGAMQILPIALLLCPVVNIITYLALSAIFGGKESDFCKAAMDEGNATAAYIMTERGADVTKTNHSGKTLLDLFAAKREKAADFSSQDLDIIEALFEKGVSANFSHKGFQLLLDRALEEDRQKLVVFLLKNGIEPTAPWTSYLSTPTVEAKQLPTWAQSVLPSINDTTPLGEDLCRAATTETLLKFSRKGDPVHETMRIFGQNSRNCPLILGESEVQRRSLMTALTREILDGNVPNLLQKKRVVGVDFGSLNSMSSKDEFRKLLSIYVSTLKANPNLILYFYNFDSLGTKKDTIEILTAAITGHTKEMKKAIGELASTGRAVFSMSPAIYKQHFSIDPMVQQGFTTIEVSKPSEKEAIPILHSMKQDLEAKHLVTYTPSAIQAAIHMVRYIPESKIPQTSYEILDSAAALFKEQETKGSIATQEAKRKKEDLLFDQEIYRLRNGSASQKRLKRVEEELQEVEANLKRLKEQDALELKAKTLFSQLKAKKAYLESLDSSLSVQTKPLIEGIEEDLEKLSEVKATSNIKFEVDRELVAAVVASRSGIPIDRVRGADKDKLNKLEETIGSEVIGQEAAVKAITKTLKTARVGLRNESKPRGSFLCAGTSGTGKTEMAKAIARNLFGDERNMTRLDMSEYQREENSARLIGAPPGYVGHDQGGQLTESLKRNPYQVILLDEVEKAHHKVLTLLLQILSDGRITDGKGNVVDCSQAVFIMTTNLGSRELAASFNEFSLWNPLNWRLRFKLWRHGRPAPQEVIQLALKNSEHFSPELIGRLKIVTFDPLTRSSDLQKITQKVLKQHREQILQSQGIELIWSDKVVEVLARNGASIAYGARPLIDRIETHVLDTLSEMILEDKIKEGDTVQVGYDETRGVLTFKPISE